MTSGTAAIAQVERFEQLLLRWSAARDISSVRVREAFTFAQTMYQDRQHWAGESLVDHVLGVLEQYLAFEPDEDGIIACLLHHVRDSKRWTLDDVEAAYGRNVRTIISGVHLLSYVTTENRRVPMEHLRQMFLRVSGDMRVVLLILCDHAYKLDRLRFLTAEQRKNICRDVLDLFAPVAARLGIYSLKHRMEARAFPVLYPVDAQRITEQLLQVHGHYGYFMEEAATTLQRFLQESGVPSKVEGREKQPYSIFRKMDSKTISHVQDLYDLFALRVVVLDETSCYQTLGLLHRLGHPVVGRFKDYIAFPKPNGYQSLHTTLAQFPGVPEGVFIEIQIRTEAMQREAEYGVAAHWHYKEGGAYDVTLQRTHLQRALVLSEGGDTESSSVFSDHIFVLTPAGELIELPEGATPLDFAFHIHTTLGLSFRAARVNGGIVPIDYQLENGDVVEIIKHADPQPSPRWIQLLKTASARSRLKRYLVLEQRPVLVARGRELLSAELQRLHLPPLDADLSCLRTLAGSTLSQDEREDLLMKIGQGAERAAAVIPRLDAIPRRLRMPSPPDLRPVTGVKVARVAEKGIPMPVRYARCCKPDLQARCPIAGVIGRDGEVRVHCATCNMLRHVNPERRIGVVWVEEKIGRKKR